MEGDRDELVEDPEGGFAFPFGEPFDIRLTGEAPPGRGLRMIQQGQGFMLGDLQPEAGVSTETEGNVGGGLSMDIECLRFDEDGSIEIRGDKLRRVRCSASSGPSLSKRSIFGSGMGTDCADPLLAEVTRQPKAHRRIHALSLAAWAGPGPVRHP
jgi:hypothetical protein